MFVHHPHNIGHRTVFMNTSYFLRLLPLIFGFSFSLQGAEFHPISSVTTTTVGDLWPVSNLIQGPGVGIDANEPHSKISAGSTGNWVTGAPGGFPSDFIQVAGEPVLVFDLGADVTLSEISIWGYSSGNANGAKDFSLRFGTEAEGEAGLGGSITYNPSFAATNDDTTRQSFPFDQVVTARYVELTAESTHITNGGSGGPDGPAGGDRVGLGEVAFEAVELAPDPQISIGGEIELALTTSRDVYDLPVGNTGGAALVISDIVFTGPNAAAFDAASFPSNLASLGSDVIEVQFDPVGLVGPVSAIMEISSNDPVVPVKEVLLTGTVPPTEQDIIVPGPIDRGRVPLSETFEVLIENGGGSALVLTDAVFSGPEKEAFTVLAIPASIPSLSSAFIEVEFNPAGLNGPVAATLEVSSNDPDSPTAEVLITAVALGDTAQFYPITSVESSTAANDLWPVSNLIQGPGQGFDAAQPHSKTSDGANGNWVTAACGFPCDYIETTGQPVLIFDLGQNVPLCEISVWGYSASNSNGLSEFSLRFATEGDGPAGFGTSIGFNPIYGGIDSGLLPNEDNTSRFSFLFGQEVVARYVELTCVDNHFVAPGDGSGGEIPGGDRVGIGEVAFEITSCETPRIPFSVEAGENETLVLSWASEPGQLYNIRTETDPASAPPVNWPLLGGGEGIEATPPTNTLVINRPADPFRLFVVEGYPKPPTEAYAESFDGGAPGWTTGNDGVNGTNWELGSPVNANLGPAEANTLPNCYGTNLNGKYENEANAWLRSPSIDLTGASEATLVFSQFIDIEQDFDFGHIYVLSAADDSRIGTVVEEVTGLSDSWQEVRYSLPAVALGQEIKIEFRLETDDFVDDVEFAGFYVDDVRVLTR